MCTRKLINVSFSVPALNKLPQNVQMWCLWSLDPNPLDFGSTSYRRMLAHSEVCSKHEQIVFLVPIHRLASWPSAAFDMCRSFSLLLNLLSLGTMVTTRFISRHGDEKELLIPLVDVCSSFILLL